MSKSRGNVINPDDVVKAHGADILRLYEMFMGPLEAVKPWQTNQLIGMIRYRDKVINLVANYVSSHVSLTLITHLIYEYFIFEVITELYVKYHVSSKILHF